uniref:DNA polymerase III beta sliding clamp central domain-containing protein n=1 Tax=Dictyoglomus turgidum TaxID=513050 RepID=A0A7C3WSI6_9BACT
MATKMVKRGEDRFKELLKALSYFDGKTGGNILLFDGRGDYTVLRAFTYGELYQARLDIPCNGGRAAVYREEFERALRLVKEDIKFKSDGKKISIYNSKIHSDIEKLDPGDCPGLPEGVGHKLFYMPMEYFKQGLEICKKFVASDYYGIFQNVNIAATGKRVKFEACNRRMYTSVDFPADVEEVKVKEPLLVYPATGHIQIPYFRIPLLESLTGPQIRVFLYPSKEESGWVHFESGTSPFMTTSVFLHCDQKKFPEVPPLMGEHFSLTINVDKILNILKGIEKDRLVKFTVSNGLLEGEIDDGNIRVEFKMSCICNKRMSLVLRADELLKVLSLTKGGSIEIYSSDKIVKIVAIDPNHIATTCMLLVESVEVYD